MSGDYISAKSASIRGGGLNHEPDRLTRRIDQCVKRGNYWSHIFQRSDAENYIEGNIKFAFEYMERWNFDVAKFFGFYGHKWPLKCAIAERCSAVNLEGESGRKLPDYIASQSYVIIRWNQQPVLVNNIHLIDEVEKIVPSRFTMWPQIEHPTIRSCPGILGKSLLYGFCKPVCFSSKGKLDFSLGVGRNAMGRNNVPIGMVERRTEIVNDISGDQTCIVYDGLVLFRPQNTLLGFGIGFDNKDEGSRFAEKFAKLGDVFRGPINLEKCAVCHGEE